MTDMHCKVLNKHIKSSQLVVINKEAMQMTHTMAKDNGGCELVSVDSKVRQGGDVQVGRVDNRSRIEHLLIMGGVEKILNLDLIGSVRGHSRP